MRDTCQYCGARARAWHGDIVWCRSARCDVLHEWATWEPRLVLPLAEPTLWQRAWAVLAYAVFRAAATAVPIGWVMPDYAWTAAQSLAVWVHGGAYYWRERMAGRI